MVVYGQEASGVWYAPKTEEDIDAILDSLAEGRVAEAQRVA